MGNAGAIALRAPEARPILFAGRSFTLASSLPRAAMRDVEREIEARGGIVHPFLTAVTNVLVLGCLDGDNDDALWARSQVRRGALYRDRWSRLEILTEDELRAELAERPQLPPHAASAGRA